MRKNHFISVESSLVNRKQYIIGLLREIGFDVHKVQDENVGKMSVKICGHACMIDVGRLAVDKDRRSGPCGGRVTFKFLPLAGLPEITSLHMAAIRVNCKINVQNLKDRLTMLIRKCDRLTY